MRKNEPERLKLKTMGTDGFAIGKQTVDLRYLEQLIDSEQTACLGMLKICHAAGAGDVFLF